MSLITTIKASFLSQGIQQDIVDTLLAEYTEMKKAAFKNEEIPTLLHSAKFSDLSLGFVKNYIDKTFVDINAISTNVLVRELINKPKTTAEETILLLAVPRTVTSIHAVRNKKMLHM